VIFILIQVPKENVLKRAVFLWTTTLFFTVSVIMLVVPKVEKYSQNALIEFFKSHAGKDVYLKNIYFKSYATWFYGATTPPRNPDYYDENWLLTGNIDKDVYFVTKIHLAEKWNPTPILKRLGEKWICVLCKKSEIVKKHKQQKSKVTNQCKIYKINCC
jgi:hypothetical protein